MLVKWGSYVGDNGFVFDSKGLQMSDFQLGVIGGGNMAEAILRGVIRGNFLPHSEVVASEPLLDRRRHLGRLLNISTVEDNSVPASCKRILLAVKPQKMPHVLERIAPVVRDDATVMSIAAGVSTDMIDKGLGNKGAIVRIMPNTPMLVGAGMCAIAPGPRAAEADLAFTEKLFGICGRVVRVNETMMDAVTAVSGSGPAYFFYLVEAMIEAGVAEGLDEDIARMLAVETCLGAGRMLSESEDPPEVLRARVTSPQGTTQRAIEAMDSANVRIALVDAVRKAAARSRELSSPEE